MATSNEDLTSPSGLVIPITIPFERAAPGGPTVEHFIVEFPGYVKSEARVMATLDGPTGLAQQRLMHAKNLKLRLRPGDSFAHPIVSDDAKSTSSLLVLRLTRTNCPIPALQSGNADSKSTGSVHAEVVAVIDKVYGFSGPADYQYAGRDLRPLESQYTHGGNDRELDQDPDYFPTAPLLATPPMFATEHAIDYQFRQYRAADEGVDVLGKKSKRSVPVISVDFFAAEVPEEVPGPTSGMAGEAGTALDALVARLRELFDRRPVYLEAALGHALGALPHPDGSGGPATTETVHVPNGSGTVTGGTHSHGVFPSTRSQHEALAKLCYRFKNGPWKGAYVRKGYDPRNDPNARQYQVLEYVLPAEWYKKLVRERLEKSLAKQNDAVVSTGTAGTGAGAMPPIANTYVSLCGFAGIQSTSSTQLQLCDLEDVHLREALCDAANVAPSASDASGWLTQSAWEGIKSRASMRFQTLLDQSTSNSAAAARAEEQIRMDNDHNDDGGVIPLKLMRDLLNISLSATGRAPAPAPSSGTAQEMPEAAVADSRLRNGVVQDHNDDMELEDEGSGDDEDDNIVEVAESDDEEDGD